jgi:hypothetical protein
VATFITPYSGTAVLTPVTGLVIVDQGLWRYNPERLESGTVFELSLTSPTPLTGGELYLRAQNWSIAEIGNELTSYTDPDSGTTYGPELCRITVRGRWQVPRSQNSDSYNSFGIDYDADTRTSQGDISMSPQLFGYTTQYQTFVIQGAAVTGGALDTFSHHVFYCRLTEVASSDNSNRQFQSNTTTQPVYRYSYSKSWQISASP